ncbi:hypothetical protein AB1L30_14760 [Bremerella sp. JC817]|uniref:hypothetical protein n=1 Tax=Bremerella sp. JC817 TaxID=3231756 RepID=UPI0034590411
MQRRTAILLGALAFWSTTTLDSITASAQEVIVAPVLNTADGSEAGSSAESPMIRVALVPAEKKDPFKPQPPTTSEEAPVLEPATGDASAEEAQPAEKPADKPAAELTPSKELPAATLEVEKEGKPEQPAKPEKTEKVEAEQPADVEPADEQPAPLMQDQQAKPIKEGDVTPMAEVEVEPVPMEEPEVVPPLPGYVQALQPRIHRVLDYYYRTQPGDASKHDVWETMHGFLPWGVDALIRTPDYRQPVSAIGWVCWNKPCRGNRLFAVQNGQLMAKQGPRVQGHHGQFLAMLAQSYVAPSYEIQVDGQTFTVQDLIEFEKATCVPKSELTFKLLALSYYLPADATWKSRDGQEWSLERLLKEEITQKVVGAACGGTHRLTGISFALAARKKAGLPMDGVWEKAEEYINAYHKHSFQIQNPDGSFSTNWFEGRGMDRDVDRRLQTSGHILEFLIYSLPPEKLTSPEVVRAVNYVTTILEQNPRHDWSIGPRGHALHALVLYDQLVFGTKPGSRTQEILQTSHD